MICKNKKCAREIPDAAKYCPWCGKKQEETKHKPKSRANGLGTVYRLPEGKWMAVKTVGWITDPLPKDASPDTKPHRRRQTVRRRFATRKEVVDRRAFKLAADPGSGCVDIACSLEESQQTGEVVEQFCHGEHGLKHRIVERSARCFPVVVQSILAREIGPLCEAEPLLVVRELIAADLPGRDIGDILLADRPVWREVSLNALRLAVALAIPVPQHSQGGGLGQSARSERVVDGLFVAHSHTPLVS